MARGYGGYDELEYTDVYGEPYPLSPARRGRRYHGEHNKPVTSRVGTGSKARITIETGGQRGGALEAGRDGHLERLEMEKVRLEKARREAKAGVEMARKPRVRYQSGARPPSPRRYSPSSRSESEGDKPGGSDDDEVILDPIPPARRRRRSRSRSTKSAAYSEIENREEVYDFQLPPRVQATSYEYVEDVAFPLSAESSGDSPKPPQTSRPAFKGSVTEVPITQSRWLGSTFDRGALSAEVSVPSSAASAQLEKPSDPLMKWYHLERPTMSLEEFIAAAQSVLSVPEKKRRSISRLLRDVQAKFERQRQHGRDLEPDCVSDVFIGDVSRSGKSESLMFLAFPYFCLEPYDTKQFQSLTPGSPMHPLRSLLQSHFHSTSQKRELAQAISNLPSTGAGNCLHLSQVWCLVVDGESVVTCSRQSHDALCNDSIQKSDVSTSDDEAKIRVSLGNERSWLIPVKEDTTWPAFLSNFAESIASLEEDGATARLDVNGETVSAEQWPSVLRAAKTGFIGLDLQQTVLQPGHRVPLPDLRPYVAASGEVRTATDAQNSPEARGDGDVAASAARIEETGSSLSVLRYTSGPSLESLADNLDDVLRENVRKVERAAYNRVPVVKLTALLQTWRSREESSGSYNAKLMPLSAYLFRFFWPTSFDHPLAGKYWGAIEQLLLRESPPSKDLAKVSDVLDELIDDVVPAMKTLTDELDTFEQDLQPLPDAYCKAFLHLIMAFVLSSQTSKQRNFGINNSTIRAHIRGLKEELRKGKHEITTRLRAKTPDLEDLEICSTASLLTLVLNQLSQDVMRGKPDVASTYADYFAQLDFRITEDPSPRSHQETLRFFLQEIEAILSTLEYQRSVLEAFEQSLAQQSATASSTAGGDNFLLAYALGESRQQIVLDTCKNRIAARIDKFRGLQQRAEDLGEWHRNEMQTNKDRQENAILIFTIVTIVFLPLSFVSSVFGMNVSDIRDMGQSQWVYWATGVPLTVLVVVASLWWAGEFEGFGRWVQKAFERSESVSGGYRRIPEPVTYGAGRPREEGGVRYDGRKAETGYYEYDPPPHPPPPRRRTTYPRRRGH